MQEQTSYFIMESNVEEMTIREKKYQKRRKNVRLSDHPAHEKLITRKKSFLLSNH
jgi:hypothetical protein